MGSVEDEAHHCAAIQRCPPCKSEKDVYDHDVSCDRV